MGACECGIVLALPSP